MLQNALNMLTSTLMVYLAKLKPIIFPKANSVAFRKLQKPYIKLNNVITKAINYDDNQYKQ